MAAADDDDRAYRAAVEHLDSGLRVSDFECAACSTEISAASQQPEWAIEDASYCDDCVRRQWQTIVDGRGSLYAPRIARAVFDLADFSAYLPENLVSQVLAVQRVFEVPMDERVWCQHLREATGDACNHFVGRRMSSGAADAVQDCARCGQPVCLVCGQDGSRDGDQEHLCHYVDRNDEEDARMEEEKGRTWQNCPRCHVLIEKEDGCNHMVCGSCAAQFCFICGQPSDDMPPGHGEHWEYPMPCSRYNHPIPRRGEPLPLWKERLHSAWIALTMFDGAAVRYNASHFPDAEILLEYQREVFEDEGEFAASGMDLSFERIDAARPSIWRKEALRITEIHDRFRQKLNNSFYRVWAGDAHERTLTWNRRFVKLLAVTRHVLTTAHNMLVSPAPDRDPDAALRGAFRRILLAHYVKIMRERWLEFGQCDHHWLIMGRLKHEPTWEAIMEFANPLQTNVQGLDVSQQQLGRLISTFAPEEPSPPDRNWIDEYVRGESEDRAAMELGRILRGIVPFLIKPALLSIADSIVLRSFQADLNDHLIFIEDSIGRRAFSDHDRSHQVALVLAGGMNRSIEKTPNPTNGSARLHGFWADSKQWVHDLKLAISQEYLRLHEANVAVPDTMWHLYKFVEVIKAYIDDQLNNPTWSERPQDRPAIDERLEFAWNVYRHSSRNGPLGPVFARPFDRLKDLMHQYSTTNTLLGLGVPEWQGRRWHGWPFHLDERSRAGLPPAFDERREHTRQEHLSYFHEYQAHQQAVCSTLLEQGQEPSYRVRRRLYIIQALLHLQIRLLEPRIHDRERNSEMYRRLYDFQKNVGGNQGEDAQFREWSRGDASLYAILDRHLRTPLEENIETNPWTENVAPEVWNDFLSLYQQTAQDLEDANVSDAHFLLGISITFNGQRQRFRHRWGFDDWQDYAVIDMLVLAHRYESVHSLPVSVQRRAWSAEIVEEFWELYRLREAFRRYNVISFTRRYYRGVNMMEAMPRIETILQRLIEDMARPYADLEAFKAHCVEVTGVEVGVAPEFNNKQGVVVRQM